MNKIGAKSSLSGIKFNELLAKYTTFKIGGPAKYFFIAQNEKDLSKVVNWAKENKIPYFILGSGSNLLVSDKGFDGLIIKLNITSLMVREKTIIADSGVLLSQIVALALKNNLTGFEWAVGIPGTVGGAVRGNAGAFGSSMAEVIKSVRVVVIATPTKCRGKQSRSDKAGSSRRLAYGETPQDDTRILEFKNSDCQFFYRDSIFKKKKNLIIFSVKLNLKKGKKDKIKKKIKEYLSHRQKTQPLRFPSAGSIFKNIEVAKLKNKKIINSFPLEKIKKGKLSVAYLIEEASLKGKKKGKAQISARHANFIVNLGGAKAKDVIYLIKLIKNKVKKKFGIDLEEEIQYLGF